MNMISITGFNPLIAAPTAAPAIAASEIGVSSTRPAPNRSLQAATGAEGAAALGDVLANQDDRRVFRHRVGERHVDGAQIAQLGHQFALAV